MRLTSRAIGLASFLLALLLSGAAVSFAGVSYTYDTRGRVQTAAYDEGISVTYTYDNAGNRLAVTGINTLDYDYDGLPDALEKASCTLYNDADTDNDGIADGVEDANHNGIVDPGETNPCLADTDGDGIQDGTEAGYTLADITPDTDRAVFVPDADPSTTTSPVNPDTDHDGIADGAEDLNHNGRVDNGETNPFINDNAPALAETNPADGSSVGAPAQITVILSDPDGVNSASVITSLVVKDGTGQPVAGATVDAGGSATEKTFVFTPAGGALPLGTYTVSLTPADLSGNARDYVFGFTVQAADSDNDGLTDDIEAAGCTDPTKPDTDNDGLLDGIEDANHNGVKDIGETNPCDADTDHDGIVDGVEDANHNGVVDADETDPRDADTDDDGIADGVEDANHNGVVDAGETDPRKADTDGDGIQDGTESGVTLADIGPDTNRAVFIPDADPTTMTNPLDSDTDHDGVADGVEDANHNGRVDTGETNPVNTAGVNVSGAITSDTTWVPWNNPYIVTGDVDVINNATLTIKPGVVVKFDEAKRMNIGVNGPGALSAVGTATAPIKFTSNLDWKVQNEWWGIVFGEHTKTCAAKLVYCTIEYASQSLDFEYLVDPGLIVTQCKIYNVFLSGIRLYNSSITISQNVFWGDDTLPSGVGVLCFGNNCGRAVITCNSFNYCETGIQLSDEAKPLIAFNNFLHSKLYGIKNYNTVGIVTANNNYWGSRSGPYPIGTGDKIDPAATVIVTSFATSQITCGPDSDHDGLSDALENSGCTDPYNADTDGDGLIDGGEDTNHNGRVDAGETDPRDTDTDNDGLSDGDEVCIYKTDPCRVDTDGDGIHDGTEVGLTLADIGPDTDKAVFVPDLDPSTTTDPTAADTNHNGLSDGQEDSNFNGRLDAGETDPSDTDTDDDGIINVDETAAYGTDPLKADTDGDGIQDGTELGYGSDNVGPDTNPAVFRPDLDDTTTTNPLKADSDQDGLTDGQEDANFNGRVDSGETNPNAWDNPANIDLTHGKTVSVSSQRNNCPKGNAVDDNETTYWMVNSRPVVDNEWISVDLGTTPCAVNKIRINGHGGDSDPGDFIVQGSNAATPSTSKTGSDWTTLTSVLTYTCDGCWEVFSFSNVTVYRHIRLWFVTGGSSNQKMAIDEIEIVGQAAPPPMDSDGDGLSDAIENAGCTDPHVADTDKDGLSDGVEDANHNGRVDSGETNPCDMDTDDDGLLDGDEVSVYHTNPCNVDTDGDGIQDGTEAGYTLADIGPDTNQAVFVPDLDPNTTTNPANADTDGDGLTDGQEDTNHNGRVDAGETDPNNSNSNSNVSGNIVVDTTWTKANSPYTVVGDVTVTDNAKLTIEPGVTVKFDRGKKLSIGTVGAGALYAVGTAAEPIVFTSSASTPAVGDWSGITFGGLTNTSATDVKYCTVEYGGYTNSASLSFNNVVDNALIVYYCTIRNGYQGISLSDSSVSIQYNTIKNNSQYGIYASGNGCDNAPMTCNTITLNFVGIRTDSGAQPTINNDNFIGNSAYGVSNASTSAADTVTANGNWWNNRKGPNVKGDKISANVSVSTYLTKVSSCAPAP